VSKSLTAPITNGVATKLAKDIGSARFQDWFGYCGKLGGKPDRNGATEHELLILQLGAGAFLGIVFILMTLSIVSDGIYHAAEPETEGFAIEVAEGSGEQANRPKKPHRN
jgi:hypothetical protein